MPQKSFSTCVWELQEGESATEPAPGPNDNNPTGGTDPPDNEPVSSGGGEEDSGLPVAGYVGIGAAVMAVVVGALIYLVFRNRKKRKDGKTGGEAAGGKGGKDVEVDQLHYVRSLCQISHQLFLI